MNRQEIEQIAQLISEDVDEVGVLFEGTPVEVSVESLIHILGSMQRHQQVLQKMIDQMSQMNAPIQPAQLVPLLQNVANVFGGAVADTKSYISKKQQEAKTANRQTPPPLPQQQQRRPPQQQRQVLGPAFNQQRGGEGNLNW